MQKLLNEIKNAFPSGVEPYSPKGFDVSEGIEVSFESVWNICQFLNQDLSTPLVRLEFWNLVLNKKTGESIHQLLLGSSSLSERYFVRFSVSEANSKQVPSLIQLWPNANFYQQEFVDRFDLNFLEVDGSSIHYEGEFYSQGLNHAETPKMEGNA